MRTLTPSILSGLLLLTTIQAQAWESECHKEKNRLAPPTDINKFISEVQNNVEKHNGTECGGGTAVAKRSYYGEHTLITLWGMKAAGLGFYAVKDPLGAYYTLEKSSDAVATLGQIRERHQGNNLTIAEYAQIPDVSYSIVDNLLGNERCFPLNAADDRTDIDQVAACHSYFDHIALVNSSHFGTQSQYFYAHYHYLALDIAQRCSILYDQSQNDDGSGTQNLSDGEKDYIQNTATDACIEEALAFEAVGAHYLEDHWSTGHMWERWGSPLFSPDPIGRHQQLAAGALSGLEHGSRALLEGNALLRSIISSGTFHDQLCLPVPVRSTSTVVRYSDIAWPTTWTQDEQHTFLGAGDDYLLDKRASLDLTIVAGKEKSKYMGAGYYPSLELWPELSPQKNAMIYWVAKGFWDVYQQSPGPKMPNHPNPPAPPGPPQIAPGKPLDWYSQVVTNHSMFAGFWTSSIHNGVNSIRGKEFVLPIAKFATTKLGSALSLSGDAALAVAFSSTAITVYQAFERRSTDVYKTDSARLIDPDVTQVFGNYANYYYTDPASTVTMDDQIRNNYPTFNNWTDAQIAMATYGDPGRMPTDGSIDGNWDNVFNQPATLSYALDDQWRKNNTAVWLNGRAHCSNDNDANCLPWQYCAETPAGGRCMWQSDVLEAAFKDAEWWNRTQYSTDEDLDNQAAICRATGGSGAACEACVDALVPRIANACGTSLVSAPTDPVPSGGWRLWSPAAAWSPASQKSYIADGWGRTKGGGSAEVLIPYDPDVARSRPRGETERQYAARQFCTQGLQVRGRTRATKAADTRVTSFPDVPSPVGMRVMILASGPVGSFSGNGMTKDLCAVNLEPQGGLHGNNPIIDVQFEITDTPQAHSITITPERYVTGSGASPDSTMDDFNVSDCSQGSVTFSCTTGATVTCTFTVPSKANFPGFQQSVSLCAAPSDKISGVAAFGRFRVTGQ